MNVGELIGFLKTCPTDFDVIIYNNNDGVVVVEHIVGITFEVMEKLEKQVMIRTVTDVEPEPNPNTD